MNTFPNEVIDIVGIGASTLDRFIVVDHFPSRLPQMAGVRWRLHYPRLVNMDLARS